MSSSYTSGRWGERDTMKLIELYKKYRFLWDYESEMYKNIPARKQAFKAILKELDIPGFTTDDVRSKIKNLRTAYYQEKRKMAIAKQNNTTVKPLRWFHAFKSVMNGIYSRKVGDSVSDESEDNGAEEEMESVVPSHPNIESDSFLEEVPSNEAGTYVVSIKQEFLDEMENQGDKSFTPTISDYLEPVPAKRARQEAPKPIESPSIPTTSEVPKSAQRQRNIVEKSEKKADEFQMFANNIAHQLRKLPLIRALNLQIEVQTLIAKERIELIKKQDDNNQEDDSS